MRRALALLAFVALAACSREPGSAPPATWAPQIAAVYADPRGDAAAVSRMGRGADVGTVLTGLRESLGADRNGRVGIGELIGFALTYEPIWQEDTLQTAEWDARRARIALTPEAQVEQWRAALATSSGGETSEIWVIGYLIDTPSLYPNGAFSIDRSTQLLTRLGRLSPEAMSLIGVNLNIDRAWAAMLIVQNDDLFNDVDLDADKFARAVEALGQAVTPVAAAPVAPAATQEKAP
jgi:hypothetical protein